MEEESKQKERSHELDQPTSLIKSIETDRSIPLLSSYIHRFRYGAPTSVEERQREREERKKAFWWLDAEKASNKPAERSPLYEEADRLAMYQSLDLDQHHSVFSHDSLLQPPHDHHHHNHHLNREEDTADVLQAADPHPHQAPVVPSAASPSSLFHSSISPIVSINNHHHNNSTTTHHSHNKNDNAKSNNLQEMEDELRCMQERIAHLLVSSQLPLGQQQPTSSTMTQQKQQRQEKQPMMYKEEEEEDTEDEEQDEQNDGQINVDAILAYANEQLSRMKQQQQKQLQQKPPIQQQKQQLEEVVDVDEDEEDEEEGCDIQRIFQRHDYHFHDDDEDDEEEKEEDDVEDDSSSNEEEDNEMIAKLRQQMLIEEDKVEDKYERSLLPPPPPPIAAAATIATAGATVVTATTGDAITAKIPTTTNTDSSTSQQATTTAPNSLLFPSLPQSQPQPLQPALLQPSAPAVSHSILEEEGDESSFAMFLSPSSSHCPSPTTMRSYDHQQPVRSGHKVAGKIAAGKVVDSIAQVVDRLKVIVDEAYVHDYLDDPEVARLWKKMQAIQTQLAGGL